MGFGGEGGGGVNLINNKFPSAPQSHALCLIALYWFFSLSFFSFLGRALLSFWNNQVAKVDLGLECHLFSCLLLHPLTLLFFFFFSSFPLCTFLMMPFVFYTLCGFPTVKVVLKWLWTFPICLWGIFIGDGIHRHILHICEDEWKRKEIRHWPQDLKIKKKTFTLKQCAVQTKCPSVLCKITVVSHSKQFLIISYTALELKFPTYLLS